MKTIKIKGMRCGHCEASVTKALSEIDGISNLQVNLTENTVTFEETSAVSATEIKEAIEKIGFEVEE